MKNKLLYRVMALCLILMLALSAAALASGNETQPIYSSDDLFTDRDSENQPDLSEAAALTLSDGQDITIDQAGVYVLSGQAAGVTVYVDAPDDAKVQLVLDGVTIENTDFPCVYVRSADKVFLTVTADSSLSVTGAFRKDGETKTDGVIFSRADLTLNGTAALTIASSDNGVVGKDDLKICGLTLTVTAADHAVEANDSIRVLDGVISLTAGKDGLHVKENSDGTKGYIAIFGGEITIAATDDAIHATSVMQIDGGTLDISGGEGLEATVIQINGGQITVAATDDGLNAGYKHSAYQPAIIFNGGETTITMGAGDTDAVDSNGDIYINGGTISVTGQSAFDYDGQAALNGGTVIVNGTQVDSITNQMMGGMGGWGQMGPGGQMGGQMGGRGHGGQGSQMGGMPGGAVWGTN